MNDIYEYHFNLRLIIGIDFVVLSCRLNLQSIIGVGIRMYNRSSFI